MAGISAVSAGRGGDDGVADVSVVIVNWSAKDFLEGCLDSLFRSNGRLALEVLVVDNASVDGSAKMVRERFPAVKIISKARRRPRSGC